MEKLSAVMQELAGKPAQYLSFSVDLSGFTVSLGCGKWLLGCYLLGRDGITETLINI